MSANSSKSLRRGGTHFAAWAAIFVAILPATPRAHDIIGNTGPRNYESRFDPRGSTGQLDKVTAERRSALSKIAEAKRLTASENLDQAATAYIEAMALDPEVATPPMSRFLRLTGYGDLATTSARLLQSIPETSRTLRARVVAMTGDSTAALELLRSGESPATMTEPGAAPLAASLYSTMGDGPNATNVLAWASADGATTAVRAPAFRTLLPRAKEMAELPMSLIVRAFDSSLPLIIRDDPRAIMALIDEAVLAQMQHPDYHRGRRKELMASAGTAELPGAWFAARFLVREEKHAEALDWISMHEPRFRESPLWPLMAFEKAVALSNLGRASEAAPLYAAVAARTSGRTRLDALKQQARSAMALGDLAAARRILQSVDAGELAPDERKLYNFAILQVAAELRDIPGLIDAYTSACTGLRRDDRDALHQMIFSRIIETGEHLKIEEQVRGRLAEGAPSQLWYLAAEAAIASRRTPNQIEALYRLCVAQPGDHEALRALAQAVAPVAADLAAVPEQMLAVPKEEIQKLQTIAVQALEGAIRTQPLDPDNYKPLLAYHQAIGTSETAAKAAVDVVAANSDLPQIISTAAYALAINGYPQDALPLYERALKIAPDDMNIRMNHASCLTRLGRWDEAVDFYFTILRDGHLGVEYHVHELVDRIWKIEKHLQREASAIARFHKTLDALPPGRFTEAVESMGILMMNEERTTDAIRFFERQMREAPVLEERGHAQNFIGQAYLRAGQLESAAIAFADAAKANRRFKELWVEVSQGHAQALMRLERYDESVKVLDGIASELPDDSLAASSLFRAGQVLDLAGRPGEAARYYRRFLESAGTDMAMRRAAEERIAPGGEDGDSAKPSASDVQ